jgi:hypothetical protein
VSDAEGMKPVAGARVLGKGMRGESVTDAEGAAFARLFASGERAVVVYHDNSPSGWRPTARSSGPATR